MANDFTITGSNIDGASALYSLGIAYGGEKTTTGTYSSNPYDEYALYMEFQTMRPEPKSRQLLQTTII